MADYNFHYLSGTPHLRGSVFVFTSIDGGNHEVLGPSEKRRAVMFVTPASSWIVWPGPVGLGANGFNITPNKAELMLRYEDIGSLIQGSWNAQTAAGGTIMMIFECFEE